MLVMSRKVGERIVIGDNVVVTVVRIAGGMVRIGIEAPSNYMVVRRELLDAQGAVDPARAPEGVARDTNGRDASARDSSRPAE